MDIKKTYITFIFVDEVLDKCLRKTLSNLFIVTCDSSDEFLMTLLSFETLLLSNSRISLVIIDSISAFYWIDNMNCMDNFKLVEEHHKKVMSCLKKLLVEFKVNIIVSKQSLMRPKKDFKQGRGPNFNDGFEFMGKYYRELIDYRIHMNVTTTDSNDKTAVNLNILHVTQPVKQRTLMISDNGAEITSTS